MAITRLWFFTLQPSVSPADPAFTSLWVDVLELCASYTPSPGPSSSHGHVAALSQPRPRRPHHFLFQSVNSSSSSSHPEPEPADGDEPGPIFVLISTYPSLAICAQADAAYSRRLRPRVLERVRHLALRQMDMEDSEVVPALLQSRKPRAPRSPGGGRRGAAPDGERADGAGGAGGAEDEDEDEDQDQDQDRPAVAVVISSRDPLRSEVAQSLSSRPGGARTPVPPPDEEISGADVYEPPPAPAGGEDEDVFAGQRGKERKWVRISRRADAGGGDGDIEVFRLRELLSR